jgi:DNA processing protein
VASILANRAAAHARADDELARAAQLGVRILGRDEPDYPPLLRQTPGHPPILYIRGGLRPNGDDRYPLTIVGSRACTSYGLEQAERFAGQLAAAGLTIVSGGARGIDTASHRAALRAKGRTIAVLGCGLAHVYPDENRSLFDQIVAEGGALVSELPLDTPPTAENFPARNRIISGLALGTLVIEAARGSGALITAKLAAEEHGREVFALPGRVDSPASEGSLQLLRAGGASIVTSPADILDELHSPARHLFEGHHAERYALAASIDPDETAAAAAAPPSTSPTDQRPTPAIESPKLANLTPNQRRIYDELERPSTIDEISQRLGRDAGQVRADLTVLELRRCVLRRGSALERWPDPGPD